MISKSNLLDKTKLAKEKYENKSDEEQQILSDYTNAINNYKVKDANRELNNNAITTQFFNLENNIEIGNNTEFNKIFNFSDLENGTYIINLNMYSDADTNSNIFGYFYSKENNSSPYRFYFVGVNGWTISSGNIVVEHTKGNALEVSINNYCGKTINIKKDGTNAVAIKIK